MDHVELDREFVEWSDADAAFAIEHAIHELARPLRWSDLLAARRVVLLAEAGSGKTEELRQRMRALRDEGRFALYMTVEDLAAHGLPAVLDLEDEQRLEAWRRSAEPGWFLVDSIDEAIQAGRRLPDALRHLGRALGDARARAYILLSSRFTSWRQEEDLPHLKRWLPMPAAAPEAEPVAWQEALRAVLRDKGAASSPIAPDEPLVVVMVPLDDARIRRFAEAAGIDRTTAFIDALREAGARPVAGRPLGLRRLVDAWRAGRPLDSFRAMVEQAIRGNLHEDRARVRIDDLDEDRAMLAMERIGATMVLSRVARIVIADDETPPPSDALSLTDLLPDWSRAHSVRLLGRAVFDPSTFGRARLHGDNRGDVRAFLAARWIERLLDANCPGVEIRRLIFAESHEVPVVRPSMRQTAAWLALSVPWVAEALIEREPQILLEEGDAGRLPAESVRRALGGIAARLAAREHFGLLDNLALRRFARACPPDAIRDVWNTYADYADVRDFLLRLVWLGEIRALQDLVEAALRMTDPRASSIGFATRALAAAGDRDARQRLAGFVREHVAVLPPSIVWNAVEDLFPEVLGIDDVVAFTGLIEEGRERQVSHFKWIGPEIAGRLERQSDRERLLEGLLAVAASRRQSIDEDDDPEPANDLCPAIEDLADRILAAAPLDDAPDVVIRAVLWIEASRSTGHRLRRERPDLWAQIGASGERRRRLFTAEADAIDARGGDAKGGIDHPLRLNVANFHVRFECDDARWLVDIALEDHRPARRRLALRLALRLVRGDPEEAGRVAEIRARIADDSDLGRTLVEFFAPPTVRPEEEAREKRWAERKALDEAERRKNDAAWEAFVDRLRADPTLLHVAARADTATAAADLTNAFHLLSMAARDPARWSITDAAPLIPVLGEACAQALIDALVVAWRHLPHPQPDQGPARRPFSLLDRMRLSGVAIEAGRDPRWAEGLDADAVANALDAAFLELSMPSWVDDLARIHPTLVAGPLAAAVIADLVKCDNHQTSSVLHGVADAGLAARDLVAPGLLEYFVARLPENPAALIQALRVLVSAQTVARDRLLAICLDGVCTDTDPARVAAFAWAGFVLDPIGIAAAVESRLQAPEGEFARAVAEHLLALLFGDRAGRTGKVELPFAQLVWLVRSAFAHVRLEDDIRRAGIGVYTPELRDDAQDARDAAFTRLAGTPGRATYTILREWAANGEFAIPSWRFMQLALERARADADDEPWRPSDLLRFERSWTTAPRTSRDLQRVGLGRLADIDHDARHGQFNRGKSLKNQQSEADVQNWVAGRLFDMAGDSYKAAREAHVVDEKEPDITLTATGTDARVAIEIKVAEDWSYAELMAALEVQLCGRYLREDGHRHGILLLVHKNTRPRGWLDGGSWLSFADVADRLRARTRAICASDPSGPQPELALLDVATVS